jgi:hypothetical protein
MAEQLEGTLRMSKRHSAAAEREVQEQVPIIRPARIPLFNYLPIII